MRRVFAWLFEVVGGGRWDHLRKQRGLSADIVFRWRTGRGLPSLEMFLTFCSRLNVEPDDVFDGDALVRLDPNVIRAESMSPVRAAWRKPNTHADPERVRGELQRALEIEPSLAPPLAHLANRIGVGSQLIRYHFPELAKAVAARWRVAFQARP